MPQCADPGRRHTVLSLAYKSSISAPQPILEEAVAAGNVELIENLQPLLEKALKSNRNENDAFNAQKPNFRETPNGTVQCKEEDCKTCFWKAICDSEETESIITRANDLMKELKSYSPVAKISPVRKIDGNRVAF